MFRFVVYVIALIFASSAYAQDFVVTKGKLSDRDFYRLVACAAPPGGECQRQVFRWNKRQLTIGITGIEKGVTERRVTEARAALRNAIKEINGVGAGIRLTEVNQGTPDIRIRLVMDRIAAPRAVRNINDFLLNSAGGRVQISVASDRKTIRRADLDIATIEPKYVTSVMLEEVIQSLGLLTDIHNRRYHNKSIFSETSSRTKRLRGQDAKALRFHYPS